MGLVLLADTPVSSRTRARPQSAILARLRLPFSSTFRDLMSPANKHGEGPLLRCQQVCGLGNTQDTPVLPKAAITLDMLRRCQKHPGMSLYIVLIDRQMLTVHDPLAVQIGKAPSNIHGNPLALQPPPQLRRMFSQGVA